MKLFGMSIKGLWYSGDLQSLRASVLLYQLVWSQFFLFFVWIPGFLILYGLLAKEFPVFHHYGYWLPLYIYGLNTFSFHCIIICCLQNYQQIYFVSCKIFQSHLFSRQWNIGTLLFLLCLSAKHVHYIIWF